MSFHGTVKVLDLKIINVSHRVKDREEADQPTFFPQEMRNAVKLLVVYI